MPAATSSSWGAGPVRQPGRSLSAGTKLTCVEPGADLAAVARRELANYPNVEVINAAFESFEWNDSSFDIVLAATSWHWLDPAASFPKAARLLRPGGKLVIVTTHHVLPDDGDPFFSEIQAVYDRIGHRGVHLFNPDRFNDKIDDIEASGLFAMVGTRRYVWQRSYTADEYLDLLDTYSDHRAMEPSKRGLLYGEIRRRIEARPDRRIRKHYLNRLHIARAAG